MPYVCYDTKNDTHGQARSCKLKVVQLSRSMMPLSASVIYSSVFVSLFGRSNDNTIIFVRVILIV